MGTRLFGLGAALVAAPAMAVTLGQVDDFEGSSTMGWDEGGASPNPPITVETGGPQGDGDGFVRNESSGGFGPGSKQIMFNRQQWAGDYVSAGVGAVSMWLRGSSPEVDTLFIRVAIRAENGTQWTSMTPYEMAADNQWRRTTFVLSDLGLLGGFNTDLDEALSDVFEFRILAAEVPSIQGDPIESTLDVDGVTALPTPGGAALLALGGFAAVRRRR